MKRAISFVLSLALLLSCVSGIVFVSAATEPYAWFDVTGGEWDCDWVATMDEPSYADDSDYIYPEAIGSTGEFGLPVGNIGGGFYWPGELLSMAPSDEDVMLVVQYYVDGEVTGTAFNYELSVVQLGNEHAVPATALETNTSAYYFATVTAEECAAATMEGAWFNIYFTGEAENVYIQSAQLIDPSCTTMSSDVEAAYHAYLLKNKINIKLEGAKDATATEEGYTGDTVCTICEKVLVQGEVIPVESGLPAPFGYFDFTGTAGALRMSAGEGACVRAITEIETETSITKGSVIGATGLYGYKVTAEGYGLFFGGKLLNEIPSGTGITYAIEYYVNGATSGNVLKVSDSVNGEVAFAAKQGKNVAFYTLSDDAVKAMQTNSYGGDTRLRIKGTGAGVGRVYIMGVKILDSKYTTSEAKPYAYYDFEKKVTCEYYPEAEIMAAYNLSYADLEINNPPGFEGYRYFSLSSAAAAYAEENVNKPVYLKFYTKDTAANTTIEINTYQVYGENDKGEMVSTHNTLIKDAPGYTVTVTDGVGGVLIPAACFRNGAGNGSFRLKMSVANTVARVEVYDVATYCAEEETDADVVEVMHQWRVDANWNVVSAGDGYDPDGETPGFTGSLLCGACDTKVHEGKEIPGKTKYAKLDFSGSTAQTVAIKHFVVTDGAQVKSLRIPGTSDYAMAISAHNQGIRFTLDADQFSIEEADLENGTNLAITVEYYMPSSFGDNDRIAFETTNSKRLAFYKNYLGTCWDAACVNSGTPLVSGKTAIATFTVGKDVVYTAEKGQFGGSDKFDTPREVETYTMAKNLVNGVEFTLLAWANKFAADQPLYIKSITVFDASQLGAAGDSEADHYYVTFKDVATNPYYPQYAAPTNNGVTTAKDLVEWYPADTDKQYPRFNYTYVRMPAPLLTTYDNFKATPVKLVIERKEGSTVDGMTFQYQRDRSDASDSARWSSIFTVNFDENGVFETVLLDATFMNGLNSQSSIRLRDVHYAQSGDEATGYTYEIDTTDDLDGIETIRLYPLSANCEAYHDQFSEGNKNLVWSGAIDSTYEEKGYSGDLVCAHCGAVMQQGEELPVLGNYAKLDFSSGVLKKSSIKGVYPIDGDTSLTPEKIPGTDTYGLKMVTHNGGIAIRLSEFAHFTLEDLENGRELAISVEYYVPSEASSSTRLAFEKKGSTIMALYTNYGGTTWDAAVLNGNSPMVRDELNVATFMVGKDVNYVTGPGQFGAANKFEEAVSVNTYDLAQALINGDEILLRSWSVNPETEDDPSTEKDETAPERAVYIRSIMVYDAAEANNEVLDTSKEYIDFETEFVSSPIYYPQYVQKGGAYGISMLQVTEQGSVAEGNDVTYVYFGVTDALKSAEQTVKPVVIRFFFKEDVTREVLNFAYQTDAPWTYIDVDIVDGMAEAVLLDATFTNGLNKQGSFRLNNSSRDPIVNSITRIEVYVIKDKTELNDLLAQSADVVKYKTPTTVAAYNAVKAEAQVVADDPWATEEQIAAAVAALKEATAGLVDCDHTCGTELVGFVAETCLTKGYSGDAACKDCGYIAPENVGAVIPAHETELRGVKAATCAEPGYTGDLWCTKCETVARSGNTINMLPHAWDKGVVTKNPTAVEYGELTRTCTVCGDTFITRLDFKAEIGDVNGDGKVESTDARLILQFVVRAIAPTDIDLDMADVDGDGLVNSTDARLLLQYAAKKIDKLPAA